MTNEQTSVGITVRPHAGSVGCTEVQSAALFWHFNPRFHVSIDDMMGRIKRAEPMSDGGFHIVVAGEWGTPAELPLAIVGAELKSVLDNAYADYMQAEGEMRQAERAFTAALKQPAEVR